MATLTTAGIHTLSLTDGTTYTVEVRVDLDGLALELGRKALLNKSGVAKEVGGLIQVRTVDSKAARLALQASRDARDLWGTCLTMWRDAWRNERGLGEYVGDWTADDRVAFGLAERAWFAANPTPARVTYR